MTQPTVAATPRMPLRWRESARADLVAWADMTEALFTVRATGNGLFTAEIVDKIARANSETTRGYPTEAAAKRWLECRAGARRCTYPPALKAPHKALGDGRGGNPRRRRYYDAPAPAHTLRTVEATEGAT
jgi:hypothetical protein